MCDLVEVVVEWPKLDIVEKIKKIKEKDEEVVRVVKEIKTGIKALREYKLEINSELVLKKEKMYVLRNKILWLEVIQLYYNIPVAKHRRKWKTIKLVTMTGVKQKEIMLGYNKNYTTLVFNYVLKNSEETILVLEIERRGRDNNIKEE